MDFALTDEQQELIDALTTLLGRHAGPARAREVAAAGGCDSELARRLREGGFLDVREHGAGPLEAVLIAEAVAQAAGLLPIGARAVVAPAVLGDRELPDIVALAPARADAPVRFGAHAELILRALDDDGAAAYASDAATVTPVPSLFGYPFATVEPAADAGRPLDGDALRRWWRVGIAAELVGTMQAALDLTVGHLSERRQFGRPIGSFQAVQHRLAELHVSIESARWLTRFAAARDAEPEAAAAAAAVAAEAAAKVAAETHQLTGAMGLTEEYDLAIWTLRMPALRLELGGEAAHARALTRARWMRDDVAPPLRFHEPAAP